VPDLSLAGADAVVLVGDSERLSDLFWATGFRAPDPFLYVGADDDAWVIVKDLELDRAREQVRGATVLASSDIEKSLGDSPSSDEVLAQVLRERGLTRLRVPDTFPVGTADHLRGAGCQLELVGGALFPARAIKSAEEVDAIAAVQAAAEAGIQAAIELLREARVDGDRLQLDGQPLTSEHVRRRIHHVLMEHDCTARHTIVAGGEQAIDPHQGGHGPLPAHRPIIIDVFPQHSESGYFGDITRTLLRGTASDEVQRLYDTVAAAQIRALEQIRAGVDGQTIHTGIVEAFADAGYATGERDGRMQGFFHGTGHGVGLDIHEAPSISRRPCLLEAGQVVTVEPGLYYAGLGGVRVEDLVVVEADGMRNLTQLPKDLVL
jgi:Xaa-Pro aminopeptidase